MAHRNLLRGPPLLVALLLLSACVTTPPAVTPGQQISSGFKLGSLQTQLYLPDGDWEVAAYQSRMNNVGTEIRQVVLVDIQDQSVNRAAHFTMPASYASGGYSTLKACERDNLHFRETSMNRRFGKQDCLFVNHFRVTYQGSSNRLNRDVGAYLAQRNITQPNHLIWVGFRIADNSSFINANYFFNPSAEGFEDYPRSTWQDSPWHPTSVHADERKKAYVNEKIDWAMKHRDVVRAGFEGDLAISAAIKPDEAANHSTKPK